MSEAKPMRIGVLCDGPDLAQWQIECLNGISALSFAEISLLVINAEAPLPRAKPVARLRRAYADGMVLWRTYQRLRLKNRVAATRRAPFPAHLSDVPRLECVPVKVGKFRERLGEQDIDHVKAYDLDVLIRFGFGILTGQILTAARYGVWSYHHGDPQHFRGAPPGFWEIYERAAVTGVVLQCLTETLDGGVILHSGWFKTDPANYPRFLNRILFGASHFVANALRQLRKDQGWLAGQNTLANAGPIYRYPRTRAMLRFLGTTTAAAFHNQFRSLFRHQQWAVGVCNEELASILQRAKDGRPMASVHWIGESKGQFAADPFPLLDGKRLRIIAEVFDWRKGRGHIALLEWPSNGAQPAKAIESKHHLSYPYVVQDDALYCAPEAAESNGVTLYRWHSAQRQWADDARILDSFPAIDPTIFKHEDRWWLLCTSAADGANEFLYLWHAWDITGPWTPHAANPVKIDVRSARPAGPPFTHQDELIRPAQDCSKEYGGRIVFNRIVKLTIDEFEEESIGTLSPDSSSTYPAGLHTISGAGNVTVVDGARWTFSPFEMARALARKLPQRPA